MEYKPPKNNAEQKSRFQVIAEESQQRIKEYRRRNGTYYMMDEQLKRPQGEPSGDPPHPNCNCKCHTAPDQGNTDTDYKPPKDNAEVEARFQEASKRSRQRLKEYNRHYYPPEQPTHHAKPDLDRIKRQTLEELIRDVRDFETGHQSSRNCSCNPQCNTLNQLGPAR